MNRSSVTSSAIVSIGYDSARLALEVEFHNGRVYEYQNVPPAVAADLLAATSHGTYFNQHVGHGSYPFRRLS